MIAVDTNILVRYYLNDHIEQAELAQRLIEHYPIYVPKTVILELEWVLRGVAKIDRLHIGKCLEHLLSLSTATIEQHDHIILALAHYQNGFDFADALHWVSSKECQSFMTFDNRGFVQRAQGVDSEPSVQLLTVQALC